MAIRDPVALADRFRRELIARQSRSVGELTRAYGLAWQRIQESLSTISRTIEIARANGLKISPAWLVQFDRLESLKRQVESEINKFADFADLTIRADQFDAIQAARANADVLLRASTGLADDQLAGVGLSFSRLPVGAIEAQVGLLANGSPLRTLLGELGKEAAGKVVDALTTAVALGYGPRRTAAMVRESLGGNAARALTIARTETMRAYREAASRTYEANADVLDGWIWTASLSGRTCAMCIAMHGTVHPLTERLHSHPNCRCTAVPRTKSFADLGILGVPDTRPPLTQSGADWFADQPTEIQKKILGPERWRLWAGGDFELADVVGIQKSKEWGMGRFVRSIPDTLKAASKREGHYLPKNVKVQYSEGAKEMVRKLFGRRVSDRALSGAVGALDGAIVRIKAIPAGVDATIIHKYIDDQSRTIQKDRDGKLRILNDYFRKSRNAPKQVGIISFAREVAGARALGVDYISTFAAGSYGDTYYNGYYTWARFGYNANLTGSEIDELPPALKSATTLNQLMRLPGGPEWWKVYGIGREMRFDLGENSESLRILQDYLREHRIDFFL